MRTLQNCEFALQAELDAQIVRLYLKITQILTIAR
jgi:hypothetical protein